MKFLCEVCGREDEYDDPNEAFNIGWDYPPQIGIWGVVSPRTCPNCLIKDTAWWAIVVDKTPVDQLDEKHTATVQRILLETQPV